MRYENHRMPDCIANGDLALIFTRMVRIGKGESEWIEEDCCGLIKRYVVLLEVGPSLSRIPLIDHTLSLS